MGIRKEEAEKSTQAIVKDQSGNVVKVVNLSHIQVGLPTNTKNITVYGSAIGTPTFVPMLAGGRLSLQSSTPVTSGSIASASLLYYTPAEHNQITLFNGDSWQQCAFTETTFQLGASHPADTNFDVFAKIVGDGGVTIETGVAWTTGSIRAVALSRVDGVYVSSQDKTKRYLGTIRTTLAGQTEDTTQKRFVWNAFNQVPRTMIRQSPDDSWVYASAPYRAANANLSNKVEFVTGDNVRVQARVSTVASCGSAGNGVTVGIGVDTAAANFAQIYGGLTNNGYVPVDATFDGILPVGHHRLFWIESAAASTTFYGDVGVSGFFQFGIVGQVLG